MSLVKLVDLISINDYYDEQTILERCGMINMPVLDKCQLELLKILSLDQQQSQQ
ncbi:unnamed protein product [Paramecium sonneborni]|uniref:Uncharacterized protein n=1 Tax=Paramecium sonneborni TaxID=65129 RepID=A0A8S1RPR4_9CILI|nr:unnamed protein product [Paramecium sonneborni]